MGSCLSKLQPGLKTAMSSQSTVVDHEAPLNTASKNMTDPEPPSCTPPIYPLPLGAPILAEFQHDPAYHNLNHASFGTIPRHLTARLRHYQDLHERTPDPFIRYTYPDLLDLNRAAIAHFINAPNIDEVVFVPNATVGINTVLRAIADTAPADALDEILHFSTIYGACGKTVDYVADATHGRITGRAIPLVYPLSDAAILAKFHAAVAAARAAGKRPRIAVFDTVSSLPGVRFPYEALVAACRALGILSMVDAAQGVGMVPLNVGKLDPDFLVSNCHKWLFVPRACAVFYVPVRNQVLLRSTVPTSHGYVPLKPSARQNPLPSSAKSAFVQNFEYVGTLDNSPYLCVRDAIEWREKVLGGEERIREYVTGLARKGGKEVARALGTWVMENEEATLGDCSMTNVAMPLVVLGDGGVDGEEAVAESGNGKIRAADIEGAAPVNALEGEGEGEGESKLSICRTVRKDDTGIPHDDAQRIWEWMEKVMMDEYKTFIPTYYHDGRFWARLSAQVYLEEDDFVWTGQTLKAVCERVAKKEYNL